MKININLLDSSGNIFYYIKNYKGDYQKLAENITNFISNEIDGFIFYNKEDTTILNKDYSYASFCGNAAKIINYMEKDIKYSSIAGNIFKLEDFYNGISLNIKKEAHIFNDFAYVNVFNDHILIKENILDKDLLLNKSIELMSKYNMNIGYYNHDKEIINLLTYERGVGFTKSCGTNSIAVAILLNRLTNIKRFKIRTNGYRYEVFFNDDETITIDGEVRILDTFIIDIKKEDLQ